MQMLSEKQKRTYRDFAREESLAYHLYMRIARRQKKPENRSILEGIALQEKKHLDIFNSYLGKKAVTLEIKRPSLKLMFYTIIMYTLGVIFTLRIFERLEAHSRKNYRVIIDEIDELKEIIKDEKSHEEALKSILNDEKLLFASSVVLGMNDALVEISGALAGFTLAINDSIKVGTLGLITGISAALSMAASEYLSRKQDDHDTPMLNALYTGISYIIVVSLLILPYFLIQIPLISMGVMIAIVIFIIFAFNYYISIAKKQPLLKNFFTMALIALVVASISFMIGLFVDSL